MLGLRSIGIENPEACAKRLVTFGLTRGVLDLLEPYVKFIQIPEEKREETIAKLLAQLPEKVDEIELTPDLLQKPEQLPIVQSYRERIAAFLHHRGLAESAGGFGNGSPEAIAARLPWYFTQGLLDEYRRNPEVYRPLDSFFDSPVTELWRRERSWESTPRLAPWT